MLSNLQRKTLCCIQLRCVTKFRVGHLPFDLLKHVCCTLEIMDTTWDMGIRHFKKIIGYNMAVIPYMKT